MRGSVEFAYRHHKALVEQLLADAARDHPELEQVVLRIGTILGERVDNQITRCSSGSGCWASAARARRSSSSGTPTSCRSSSAR